MFEQDYIMRLIREIVRVILKLLFNIDTDSPTAELLDKAQQRALLDELLSMIELGKINEAENIIYDLTADEDRDNLKIALLFYSYLNEKEDAFLEEHDFSREEIQSGLKDIISRYGLGSVTEGFLESFD